MQKNFAIKIKKNIAVFLHLIFLTLAVFGISMMYLNAHYGKGVSMVRDAEYENSEEFSNQLQEDIERIFQYVAYRDVLETNGMLDTSRSFASIRTSMDLDMTYSIDELMRYALSLGYYLDENYQLVHDAVTLIPQQENEVYVSWRAYDQNQQYAEPGDAYSTLKDLALDTLNCLSGYYTSYDRFFNHPSNLYFQIYYEDTNGDRVMYSNASDHSDVALKKMGRYCYLNSESIVLESNLQEAPKNIASYMERYNPYDNNLYYLIISVDTLYEQPDVYAEAAAEYSLHRQHYLEGLYYLGLGLAGLLLTLYYLMVVSGYQSTDRSHVHLQGFDMITTESCLILAAIVVLFGLFLSEKIASRILHLIVSESNWEFAGRIFDAVVIYLCCLFCAFSLLRRYKAGQLWSNSNLHRIVQSILAYFTYKENKRLLTVSYLSFVGGHLAFFSAIYGLSLYWQHELKKPVLLSLLVLLLIMDLRCFFLLFRKAVEKDKINTAIYNIAAGDTSYHVTLDEFTNKDRETAQQINRIGIGLEHALQEKVKSERLKADLITNVSHDIKTPLTSIITYVDLIKREEIDNPKIQNYLDVLEQKSQRLKILTEDLVEASKASSGSIKLDIADIDIVELVQQTHGEFEEKFSCNNLVLVSNLPEDPIIISADGRSLWRILENLYSNAFKYAMEHSRVFVDLCCKHNEVCFTIKNISRYPLNVHGEELTERFVRGDVSRSTEGSGLGLSIAQSLTHLQNGSFQIVIDGDLFKVVICFPTKQLPES